ncbi:MAG: hypothetical protein IJ274_15965 [Lachnospiraceae bacterium]|nr:hypothetical protein [Lachnospiraceae bacterium]
MGERICKRLLKICDVFEIIISILVGLGLIATLVSYIIPGMVVLFDSSTGTEHFLTYLGDIFNIVVGLEFMKMLCKPSSDNVIEVLVFLVSRHIIMGAHSSMDIFLSVVSITILFVLRRLLHIIKYRDIKLDLTKKNKTILQQEHFSEEE